MTGEVDTRNRPSRWRRWSTLRPQSRGSQCSVDAADPSDDGIEPVVVAG